MSSKTHTKINFPHHLIISIIVFALSIFLSSLFISTPLQAKAVEGFNPGNIITDYVMGNYKTMSVSDIQKFLTSKNSCNNTNYDLYLEQTSTYSRITWHWSGEPYNGHFVCLSEERFGEGTELGTGQTAAEIIYAAAQEYRINPQVLIVLLEKEQGLISDTFPHSNQYRSATGYGCPDTAACDSRYYGFKNQVFRAAELFRYTLDNGSILYPEKQNGVFVRYNPNASCGGTYVYIENRATASLYRYTPYQPNAAALAAGYGQGDSCSAYGNRNFYQLFKDWFGNPTEDVVVATSEIIPNGEYVLGSAVDISYLLGTKNTNVILSTRTKNTQIWRFEYQPEDHSYLITDAKTGRALDLNGAETKEGANIQLYASNRSCAQKWHVIENEDSSYTFVSACAKYMAINLSSTSASEGVNVELSTRSSATTQKWYLLPSAQFIANGLYTIQSQLDSKKVVDISGGVSNARNGTNIHSYTHNDTGAQKWQFTYNAGDATYTITNPHTGLALDVSGAGVKQGSNVQLYTSNNTCAQKWRLFQNQKDSSLTIVSACSNLALDISGGSTADGANIQVYTKNQTAAQKWHLQATEMSLISDGAYEIIPRVNERLALDINGGAEKAKAGTNIQIYEQNQTQAQKWQIIYNKQTDSYIIKNATSKLVLDVAGASRDDGANIQAYTPNQTAAQSWRIESVGSGYYRFISNCSNKVLDVAGASTVAGANVQQYQANGTVAQDWKLRKL